MKEIVVKIDYIEHKKLKKLAALYDKIEWSKEDYAMNDELCRELAHRLLTAWIAEKKPQE